MSAHFFKLSNPEASRGLIKLIGLHYVFYYLNAALLESVMHSQFVMTSV